MKVSVIVPFKSDRGGYRDFNFYLVKQRYETLMPDVELVIGEDRGEPFNKSKAVNRAVRSAIGDLLIIADADIFFGTRLINRITAIAPIHPWIIPFSRGYRLSEQGSLALIKNGRIELPQRLLAIEARVNCTYFGAFMNVMSRSAFEKAGGMDERFCGWGGEDHSFAGALDTLVGKHYRMDETIFHLWHPPAEVNHTNCKLNQKLFMRYRQAENNVEAMRKLVEEWRGDIKRVFD